MAIKTVSDASDGSLVWDNHACMPLRPDDQTFLPQLERVREAGIDVVTLNIAFGAQDLSMATAMAGSFRRWIAERPELLRLVGTPGDLDEVMAADRLGICFNVEGMDALDGDVKNVGLLYDLGVRWMLAAYNKANLAGGGCLGENSGLTEFGRSVVAEMNRVGMVVCASHCSYRTARDLIDCSATPVIFSHSNPRAMWDHPRNIPDDLMIACAERGGVVGINGFGPFLGPNDASVDTYVNHVEYALDLIGEDHVGIALDYIFDHAEFAKFVAADPVTFPPAIYAGGAAMVAPWRLPAIAEELRRRGRPSTVLAKVLGGNHVRVARTTWL